MENIYFFLLLEALDITDRQSALIAVLEAQRDQALKIATEAVAQMRAARLTMLADHIVTREDFNQDIPIQCVVGIGLKLVGRTVTGSRSVDNAAFAEYYGLTADETSALFWGQYGDLFYDELNHDKYNLHRISREEAARILRRLAKG